MAFGKASHSAHDLSRCAITALEGVMLHKGSLHGMEVVPLRQALDRRDLPPLLRDRERRHERTQRPSTRTVQAPQ